MPIRMAVQSKPPVVCWHPCTSMMRNLMVYGLAATRQSVAVSEFELGIERLLAMQRYNGSFAMWNAEGSEQYWPNSVCH